MSKTEKTIATIRKIMVDEKISVRELSEKLGKSQSATSGLLNQKNISLEMLDTICEALGYNLDINISKRQFHLFTI